MKLSSFLLFLLAAGLLVTPCFADAGEENDSRRYNFGFRVDYIPFRMFNTSTATASTAKPIADYTYTGSTKSQKFAGGPVFEWRLTKHLSVGAELSFHRASYAQVTQIRSGKKDPNAGTDARPVATITENTTANYWDVPILARYRNIRSSGIFKRFYPLAGVTYRYVGRIKTGNQIINADASTDYNEIPATVSRRNQIGFTGGIGFRFVDELGIKVVPEIRFTRWMNHTFDGLSYTSSPNQAQAGVGITF